MLLSRLIEQVRLCYSVFFQNLNTLLFLWSITSHHAQHIHKRTFTLITQTPTDRARIQWTKWKL